MAEQVGHNVVNNSESTSASALVDVAANQTTTASAEHGNHDQDPAQFSAALPETKPDTLKASLAANADATHANAFTSSMTTATLSETPRITEDVPAYAEESVGLAPSIVLDKNSAEDALLVNGIYDAATVGDGVTDDGSMREDSVDISLNSDTEGSRGDASEVKKDEKHHVRTNSVKKPVTFSKVSVTKNFLAKSATATPPIVKPGDKPSPAGTPPQPSAAKPRLIAKVGTSLRDVQKARLTAEAAGGPDASKVWNKNRPVPPPPPRQFTDEELKQQYGIHLATRLQTDEEGKQSKWADIDDDEEDWAPESVEWMDGTKSTLTANETPPPPQKEQKPTAAPPTKLADGVKPTLIMKKPTEPGSSKTVLKLGGTAAQTKQGESGAGTPSEKSSDPLKAQGNLPTKSPWAALPPVEKVSPVNPPVQQKQPPPVLAPQDARAYEPAQPTPPAREIAADTFDRSWREGEGGARELFNSTNGRYEPVHEGRRGSIKLDSAYRKPAVLQRPSNAASPAEPSAAFQTRSTTQTDASWPRRRGSSVSQGSLPPGRRMSMSKTSDASPAPATERRTSGVGGPEARASPKTARSDLAQPVFSQQSTWQQQMPAKPEPAPEEEDPVKVQERVMREKRETAKKRHEEEARLEAEKKERLRVKLASLEGVGKSRKEREAEAAAAAAAAAAPAVDTPASEMPTESTTPAPKEDEALPKPAEASAIAAPALEAQSLQPEPEAVLQKQAIAEETLPSPIPKPPVAALPERPISSTDQTQRQQPRTHLSPRANARAPFQQSGSQFKAPASSYSSPGDRKQQPFERSPLTNSNAFSPWPTTAPSGSVWGTSGIGNGTFESSNVFAPVPMTQQSSLPPPPGMSRQQGSSRISPQSLAPESRSPSLQQQAVAEPSRTFGPPGLEARPDAFANQARGSGASPAPGLGRQTHPPGPIAPPSRAGQQSQPQSAQRQASLAAWNNAAQMLPYQYKADAETAERAAKEATTTGPREDTFRETFKQTSSEQGKLGAPRRYEKTEYTIHDAQGSRSVQSLSPAPPVAQTQPSAPFANASPLPQDAWRAAGENTVRIPDGSLNPAHGGAHSQLSPIGQPVSQQPLVAAYPTNAAYPKSLVPLTQDASEHSPPPPESSAHPVHSGDGGHPNVRLPPKKPTVKLPPAQTTTMLPSMPQHTPAIPHRPTPNWGPPGSSAKPIVMQEAWQARFNGLFNRTPIQTETPPSPPKTPPKMQGPALAVASSSRVVMEDGPASNSATVSLPRIKKVTSPEGFTIDDSTDAVSKPVIEDMFKEELSFGSLPKISIPRNAAYDAMYELPPFNQGVKAVDLASSAALVEAVSQPTVQMVDIHPPRRDGYFVHLPALKLIKKFVRHPNQSRKPSAVHQDTRKTSGRFKGKGHEGGPNSPTATGTPSPQSRKTSFQKGPTPASGSLATAETGRSASWAAKPPRERGKVAPGRQEVPVARS